MCARAVFIGTMNNYGHWKSLDDLKKLLRNPMLELTVFVSYFLSPGGTEDCLCGGFTQYSTGRAFMLSEVSHKVRESLLLQWFPRSPLLAWFRRWWWRFLCLRELKMIVSYWHWSLSDAKVPVKAITPQNLWLHCSSSGISASDYLMEKSVAAFSLVIIKCNKSVITAYV